MTIKRTEPKSLLSPIHKPQIIKGIPTENTIPQKIKRFVISLATAKRGNYEQISPIAVLADSI